MIAFILLISFAITCEALRCGAFTIYDPSERSIYLAKDMRSQVKTSAAWIDLHINPRRDLLEVSGLNFALALVRGNGLIYPAAHAALADGQRLRYRGFTNRWTLPIQTDDILLIILQVNLNDDGASLPLLADLPFVFSQSLIDTRTRRGCLKYLHGNAWERVSFMLTIENATADESSLAPFSSFASEASTPSVSFSKIFTFRMIPINYLEDISPGQITVWRCPNSSNDFRSHASVVIGPGNVAHLSGRDGGLVMVVGPDGVHSTIPRDYGRFHLQHGQIQDERVELLPGMYVIVVLPRERAEVSAAVAPFVLPTTLALMGGEEDYEDTVAGLLRNYCQDIHVYFSQVVSDPITKLLTAARHLGEGALSVTRIETTENSMRGDQRLLQVCHSNTK